MLSRCHLQWQGHSGGRHTDRYTVAVQVMTAGLSPRVPRDTHNAGNQQQCLQAETLGESSCGAQATSSGNPLSNRSVLWRNAVHCGISERTATSNRSSGITRSVFPSLWIHTWKSGDMRDENHKKDREDRKSRQLSRKIGQRFEVFRRILQGAAAGRAGFRRSALTDPGVIARICGAGQPVLQYQSQSQSQGAGHSWCSTVLRAKTRL